jgi:hypothetical protein
MSKFKLAFIVLLIATIIWGIAFYHTRQEYHKYLEWLESDECPPMEKLRYQWDGIGVYEEKFGGRYIYGTAPFLLLVWFFFIGYFLSERKKPTLTVLEACHRPAQARREIP